MIRRISLAAAAFTPKRSPTSPEGRRAFLLFSTTSCPPIGHLVAAEYLPVALLLEDIALIAVDVEDIAKQVSRSFRAGFVRRLEPADDRLDMQSLTSNALRTGYPLLYSFRGDPDMIRQMHPLLAGTVFSKPVDIGDMVEIAGSLAAARTATSTMH